MHATPALSPILSAALRLPLLSPDEERSAAIAARGGCAKARDLLITRNLRLVVAVAKRYRHRPTARSMTLEDLVSYGSAGLMRAVQLFDHRKGFRFSTYASGWIHHGIRRALANCGRMIRLPVHAEARGMAVMYAVEAVEARGEEVTAESVAAEVARAASARLSREAGYPVEVEPDVHAASEALAYLPLMYEVESSDGWGCSHEVVSPPETERALEAAEASRLAWQVLDRLDARSWEVLARTYGLFEEGREETAAQVGEALGVTRQQAHRLKVLALDAARTAVRRVEQEEERRAVVRRRAAGRPAMSA